LEKLSNGAERYRKQRERRLRRGRVQSKKKRNSPGRKKKNAPVNSRQKVGEWGGERDWSRHTKEWTGERVAGRGGERNRRGEGYGNRNTELKRSVPSSSTGKLAQNPRPGELKNEVGDEERRGGKVRDYEKRERNRLILPFLRGLVLSRGSLL